MKVTLLEGKYHVEVVVNYLQLFALSDVRLTVVANDYVLSEIANDPDSYMVGARREVSTWDPVSEKIDLLIITTYFDGVVSYLRKLRSNTTVILLVHTVNYIFNKKYYSLSDTSFLACAKYVKHRLIEYVYKRNLIQYVDYFTFSSTTNYFGAIKLFPEHKTKFIEPIFHNFYENRTRAKKSLLTILIPGTIRLTDRDYLELFEAFRLIVPKLNRKICLYFLGSGQSSAAIETISQFQEIETEYFRVKCDKGILAYKDYNRAFSEADFAVLPLKTTIPFLSGWENQGETVWAGTLNDVIRFRLPSMIKGDFSIEKGMGDYCVRYRTLNVLVEKLIDWINDGSYMTLTESKNLFSKNIVANENMALINNLLDKKL